MQNTFPLQPGRAEVQENGEVETGDREIPEHLSDMLVVEGGDDFWIDDDFAIHDQIGNQSADKVTL